MSSSVVCDDKSECGKTLQKSSVLVYYHESDVPCLAHVATEAMYNVCNQQSTLTNNICTTVTFTLNLRP